MFLSIGAAARACTPAIDNQARVEPVAASISRRVMDTSSSDRETRVEHSLNEFTWSPHLGSSLARFRPARPRYTARMRSRVLCTFALILATCGLTVTLLARAEPDWSRFRGPNGSGISTAADVPDRVRPAEEPVVAAAAAAAGIHRRSSSSDRIYLTAFRGDTLVTIAIDRAKGDDPLGTRRRRRSRPKSWTSATTPRRPARRSRTNGVYVFFPDYGLIAYDGAGKERWRCRSGRSTTSTAWARRRSSSATCVVLACDQSLGSFIMAREQADRQGAVEEPIGRRRRAATRRRSCGAGPTARTRSSLPGIVSADGLRRRDRQEAVVGAAACRSR